MGWFSRPASAVVLVCTANICRSPMAAGVLRHELRELGILNQVKVDSAGTRATQPGHSVDPRAARICAREGINLGRCRARQFKQADFGRFTHILAMEESHQQWLLEQAPEAFQGRVSLLSRWAPEGAPLEIPDPYYGNLEGFEQVLVLLRSAIGRFALQLKDDLPVVQRQ